MTDNHWFLAVLAVCAFFWLAAIDVAVRALDATKEQPVYTSVQWCDARDENGMALKYQIECKWLRQDARI